MVTDRETVLTALRECRDPEIPVNIVDLGLIYDVAITDGASGTEVLVRMTLTSTGCPMSRSITTDVQSRLLELPGVTSAQVEIVWEPGWHPGLISDDGRRQLQFA